MSEKLLYSFHPIADEQQTDIWLYTCQHWSADQADQYIDGLHNKLSTVASNSVLLRDLPAGIDDNVKFFHYGRHYIFVKKIIKNQIEQIQVLSIHHDSMDFPAKLREVLEQL